MSETKKYELTITADSLVSTDERFRADDLWTGNDYEPVDVYFQSGVNGEKIRFQRKYGEGDISYQTMARLSFQIFEEPIKALSKEARKAFPVCRRSKKKSVCGIFDSLVELQAIGNVSGTFDKVEYKYAENQSFFIYKKNVFSNILFVQECLRRFGSPDDCFVLVYQEKTSKSTAADGAETKENVLETVAYRNPFSPVLLASKNVILRGAPGTGKSYLAKRVAADIVSGGACEKYEDLSDEQKKQVEFVQFHPGYDYCDFMEGLRPKLNDDGSMGFELRDGIFKKFVSRALKNWKDAQKSEETVERELSAQEALAEFFDSVAFGEDTFATINGNEFQITGVDERHIYVSIPKNEVVDKLTLNLDEIRKMLESGQTFKKIKDVTTFFGKEFATQAYSYDFALYKEIKAKAKAVSKQKAQRETRKNYVMIIDEINRGEISKILGELFFAIDPDYRGEAGAVSTQYSAMHSDPDEKFYIPENVYVIGTMNDIDRSVDSFDFAMRRRFRFIELTADEQCEMLSALGEKRGEAERRMKALNREISRVEDLNENYQIGPAYFLKLSSLDFDFERLWHDHLAPLLQEYIRGMYDEAGIMRRLATAYGAQGEADGTGPNQG